MYNRNLVSWIYLQVYFIRCFCITTLVYFMLCICMSPGMQHSVIQISQPYGLGLNETLLPQYLQKLGYATHAVGKVSGVLVFVVLILHDDLNWFCQLSEWMPPHSMKGSPGVLSIYIRKLEVPVGKAKVSCHFVWEGSGNIGCDLRRRSFSTLFSLFSRFGFAFFYSRFFSYPVKFYCNLLTQKFSTLVVCLHPWCWSLFLFSQLHIRRTPHWHFSNFQRRLDWWFG